MWHLTPPPSGTCSLLQPCFLPLSLTSVAEHATSFLKVSFQVFVNVPPWVWNALPNPLCLSPTLCASPQPLGSGWMLFRVSGPALSFPHILCASLSQHLSQGTVIIHLHLGPSSLDFKFLDARNDSVSLTIQSPEPSTLSTPEYVTTRAKKNRLN